MALVISYGLCTSHNNQLSICLCRYPHYDSNPSFSDFVSFGGWRQPAIKQYEGDKTVCGRQFHLHYSTIKLHHHISATGVGVDLNYY